MFDPYAVLGVSRTADDEEIKRAYRQLAKEYHPDLNPGKKEAEQKFKDISKAYELIGTKEKREKFERGESDEEAAASARGPFYSRTQGPGGGRYARGFEAGGFDEDLFASIFEQMGRAGAAGGSAGRGAGGFAFPGEDHHYRMEIDFRDAALGAERELGLPTGKRLQVRIPPGVSSGSTLRFKGQGGEGTGGAPPGDAYVELEVRPSPLFRREGDDIHIEIPVSIYEAVLGGEIRVPTVDGAVMLRVPPHSDSRTRLRVRGKGVARPGTRGRGDQFVSLRIVLPEELDPEVESAMRRAAERSSFDPREGFAA